MQASDMTTEQLIRYFRCMGSANAVCIADSAELLDADTPEVMHQLEALARQKS